MIEKLPPIRQRNGGLSKKPSSTSLASSQNSTVYFSPYVSIQDVSVKEANKKVTKSALKSSPAVHYDAWMKNASEKEKEIVMKALNNANEANKPRLRSPPPPPSTTSHTADILVIESNSTPVSDKELALVVQSSVPQPTPPPTIPPTPPQQTASQVQQTANQAHWIVFKQETTPDYIIEAKKRLGQIKQPHVAPTPAYTKPKQDSATPTPVPQPAQPANNDLESGSKSKESFESNSETKKAANNKHWLLWDSPGTPDYIKAIRHRLRDDRYKKLDLSKKYIEINRSKSDLDSVQMHQKQNAEEFNKIKVNRSKSSVSSLSKSSPEKPMESSLQVNSYQTVNNNGNNSNDTNKIVRANSNLSIVGTAGGGYFTETSTNDPTYNSILPVEDKSISETINQVQNRISSSQSNQTFSYVHEKPPRSGSSKMSFDNNHNHYYVGDNSSTSVPIQQWMQSAEDKDREDVLRVLKSLELSRPGSRQNTEQMIKTFVRIKSQNSNTPNPSSYRKSPAPQVRKLGTTRKLYKFPTEKSEKQFIKEHLWNQNRQALALN